MCQECAKRNRPLGTYTSSFERSLEMIRDLVASVDYANEGKMDFTLFNREIDVFIEDADDLEYAQRCSERLQAMSPTIIEKLCEYSIAYCEEFRVYFQDEQIDIPEGVTSREILEFIEPSALMIESPEDPTIIVIHLELNCLWEPEHGMEWIVRDDEVLYVGSFVGEDPWESIEHFQNGDGRSYVVFE